MLPAHLGPGSALLQVSWVYKVTGYERRKLCIHPPLIEPRSRLLRVTGRAPQERCDCDIFEEEGEKRRDKASLCSSKSRHTKLVILAGLCMITRVLFFFSALHGESFREDEHEPECREIECVRRQLRGCSSRLNSVCADVPWTEGDSDAGRGKR